MKERPILFSDPMVRAILEGRKTQTRRVVKPQPNRGSRLTRMQSGYSDWFQYQHLSNRRGPRLTRMQSGYSDGHTRAVFSQEDEPNAYGIKFPYGQPGDRLWVKETWGLHSHGDMTDWAVRGDDITLDRWELQYRADWGPAQDGCFWRPSIHMPRWASRITLEITGVRVERLNEISILDSHAEGVGGTYGETGISLGFPGLNHEWDNKTAVEQYQWLWESINGLGSWDLNPWVWVVEFKRVEGGQ